MRNGTNKGTFACLEAVPKPHWPAHPQHTRYAMTCNNCPASDASNLPVGQNWCMLERRALIHMPGSRCTAACADEEAGWYVCCGEPRKQRLEAFRGRCEAMGDEWAADMRARIEQIQKSQR